MRSVGLFGDFRETEHSNRGQCLAFNECNQNGVAYSWNGHCHLASRGIKLLHLGLNYKTLRYFQKGDIIANFNARWLHFSNFYSENVILKNGDN